MTHFAAQNDPNCTLMSAILDAKMGHIANEGKAS